MRNFIPHSIAALISLLTFVFFYEPIKEFFQKKHSLVYSYNSNSYIAHYSETQPDANISISKTLQEGIPLVLGSSEMSSSNLNAMSYNFFKEKNILSQGFGHAGFQCFAISSVLAANAQFLKNAKLLIILSPGWFEGKSAKGTDLTCFFEYNNLFALNQHIENKSIPEDYKQYYSDYLSRKYEQINSPNVFVNLLAHRYNAFYKPINAINYWLRDDIANRFSGFKFTDEVNKALAKNTTIYKFNKVSPNWDSLYKTSIKEFEKTATNNNWGIQNDYYTFWVEGKSLKTISFPKHNQELQDLKVLLKLCKDLNAKPSFVIMPLNPNVYSNLKDLSPVIEEVKNELSNYQFNYFDMYTPNCDKHEKGILTDIMHPDNYGWYQIDKFIIEEFANNK